MENLRMKNAIAMVWTVLAFVGLSYMTGCSKPLYEQPTPAPAVQSQAVSHATPEQIAQAAKPTPAVEATPSPAPEETVFSSGYCDLIVEVMNRGDAKTRENAVFVEQASRYDPEGQFAVYFDKERDILARMTIVTDLARAAACDSKSTLPQAKAEVEKDKEEWKRLATRFNEVKEATIAAIDRAQ
jgi:hypothetical protein